MFGDSEERTPLLQEQFPGQFPTSYATQEGEDLGDAYKQFCFLVGNSPADQPTNSKYTPPRDTLYYRALQHRKKQALIYALTRALTNTLLLAQVVLGAALTGLGAADSPGWLITVFGAANTIIAGLVAFLKSRGQPMRARMFRDDLDRVVDEIENSATMWRGISQKVHGYDAIDTEDAVTVRSEVARLTRLYDRAVKTNTMNDPDHYGSGISVDNAQHGLRARTGQPFQSSQPQPPAIGAAAPAPIAVAGPSADPDESPATQVASPSKDDATTKDATSTPVGTSSGSLVNHETAKPAEPTSSANGAKDSAALVTADSAAAAAPAPTDNPEESPATSASPAKAKDTPTNQQSSGATIAGASKNP